MKLDEAIIILKTHRNWLADKKNLPKTIDEKVIEGYKEALEQVKNIAYEPVLAIVVEQKWKEYMEQTNN